MSQSHVFSYVELFLLLAASVSSVSPQFYGRAIRYIKYTDIDARNLICKRDFEGPAAGPQFRNCYFRGPVIPPRRV